MPKAKSLIGGITPAQIELAAMLIKLGIATVTQIRLYFRQEADADDATLDAIMAECDRRITRRS